MQSRLHHHFSPAAIALLLAALAFPFAATALEQEFYIGVASRLMIFALAATSLNLVLGFGGMVSLGHAAYFGTGAYAVGILMQHGISSAWVSWPLAMAASAFLAAIVGLISLRTRGVYFIMITLAFAQMVYFLFISMRAYGGDDGLSLATRSSAGFDMSSDTAFYYVVLVLLAAGMLFVHRLVNSRFGRVVQGIRENETRMEAIGYPVYRYKLVCFTLGGALAGLAGALIANQNMLVSPNLLHWTQSGMLMVMVILGGVGYLFGGVAGAVAILLLEEILSGYTMHWQLALGIVLLAVVIVLPNGLLSLVRARGKDVQ
ncbi:branched-chain amino acid ABC transporter permease [Noviherbaspirillum sp. ST9]|uniref:branched-chain amino acid ABC transporter permease n=1 Tax=Noviherbaspirillum sp. ST9 TaxID=3401606 RepID=UPI003B587D95